MQHIRPLVSTEWLDQQGRDLYKTRDLLQVVGSVRGTSFCQKSSLLSWQAQPGAGEDWKCCLPKSCAERSSFCSCWALRERLSDKSHWDRERGVSLGSCVGCQYIYWPPSACPFPPWLALVPLQVVACRSFVRLWWLLGCDSCWWRAT